MGSWVTYSLACLVLWGVWGLLLKMASKGAPWLQVYFLSALASFTLALTIFLAGKGRIPINKYSGIAAMAGVFGGAGYVLFMKALEHGKASIIIPLTAMYPAVTAILALTILGEKLSLIKAVGIALAVLAAILLSI